MPGRKLLLAGGNIFDATDTPDGSRIVYTDSPGGGASSKYDVFISYSDGSNRKQLTRFAGKWGNDAIVSPDGGTVYFLGYPVIRAKRSDWWKALVKATTSWLPRTQ